MSIIYVGANKGNINVDDMEITLHTMKISGFDYAFFCYNEYKTMA